MIKWPAPFFRRGRIQRRAVASPPTARRAPLPARPGPAPHPRLQDHRHAARALARAAPPPPRLGGLAQAARRGRSRDHPQPPRHRHRRAAGRSRKRGRCCRCGLSCCGLRGSHGGGVGRPPVGGPGQRCGRCGRRRGLRERPVRRGIRSSAARS